MAVVVVQQDPRTINGPITGEKYVFVFDDVYKHTPDRMKYLFPGFAITGRFDFIGPIKGILPASVVVSSSGDKVVNISPGLLQCNMYGMVIKDYVSVSITDTEINSFKTANDLPDTFTCYLCVELDIVGCDAPSFSNIVKWTLATEAERSRFDTTTSPNIRIPVLALDVDTTGSSPTVDVNLAQTLALYP